MAGKTKKWPEHLATRDATSILVQQQQSYGSRLFLPKDAMCIRSTFRHWPIVEPSGGGQGFPVSTESLLLRQPMPNWSPPESPGPDCMKLQAPPVSTVRLTPSEQRIRSALAQQAAQSLIYAASAASKPGNWDAF